MKKIRSGQSYLYREGGIRSTVFDVRMKENIRGDLLRQALEKSLLRYPYLKTKLVEKNGDFYITKNELSVAFAKTNKYRSLGSMQVNYHLIDVTYIGKKIHIAFHHALCDGKGIKPFIETLLYYYCCLKYNEIFDSTGIQLADDPILQGEMTEPLGDSQYEVGDTPIPQIIKDGYALPEITGDITGYYRYELNISKDKFLAFAKKNNATPAILLALLVSKTIKNIHPDANKPIVCSMVSDMRKELELENTYKNCVSSLYLPYTDNIKDMSLVEQATLYREIIKEQRTADMVKIAANAQITLSDKINEKKTYDEKKKLLSFFNDFCINTYIISYMGQFQLGQHEKYVDSIHLYSSGTNSLVFNMISAGEYMTVDILQSFESEGIVNEFVKHLGECDLDFTISEKLEFATTCDKTFSTGRWQAERYYEEFET